MKAKQVNEALGLNGSKFYTHELDDVNKAWASPDGILGNHGIIIPWEFVDEMMLKYRK